MLQFSQPVYSPKDEEFPPIYPSPVSPPTPVTASQISRIITEVRNSPAVSHPQSNSNPQPRDSHTTSSPPGPEPSASERAKNMRQCFTTDIASLLRRSLSEAECLRQFSRNGPLSLQKIQSSISPTSSQCHHHRIEKAKRLQRFYWANPRKSVHSILAKSKPKQCPIPMEQLQQHFTNTYQPPDVPINSPPPPGSIRTTAKLM